MKNDILIQHLDESQARRTASPVTSIDRRTQRLIDRMLDIMSRTGYPALTAPQVGVDQRVVAVDLTGKGWSAIVLVNPELEAVSLECSVDREGCLSLPGLMGRVSRHRHVVVRGLARTGQLVRVQAAGLLGRILQHKIDHLNGVLFAGLDAPRQRLVRADRR